MFKKVGISLFFALLFIFIFHTAVASEMASDVKLDVIPALSGAEKNNLTFDCAHFTETAHNYGEILENENARVVNYLNSASTHYQAWHEELKVFEGQNIQWSKGSFAAVAESEKNMASSSSAIFSDSNQLEDMADSLVQLVKACIPESAARVKALDQFDKFKNMNSEHLTTAAEYIAQMHKHLATWFRDWTGLEDTPTQLPSDFFIGLQNDANSFSEAYGYVAEDGVVVTGEYNQFLQQILLLAPSAKAR